MKLFLIFCTLLIANFSRADIMEDFDSLGGNKVLLDRARALNPDKKIEIVQNRSFDRSNRHEFTPEASTVLGGDAYLESSSLALSYFYHINPNWSVGAKYTHFANTVSSEGQFMIDEANRQGEKGEKNPLVPDMDWPEVSTMALIHFYPIYGKFNFINKAIVHFDAYLVGGGGTMQTRNGDSTTFTVGMGIGLWFSQHLTTRFEMNYLNYEAQRLNAPQSMELTTAGVSFGYML